MAQTLFLLCVWVVAGVARVVLPLLVVVEGWVIRIIIQFPLEVLTQL
jgi:hypothetical protein